MAGKKTIQIKTAIVLAGGEGLRLRPLTANCPKPMVKLLGKPLLQWVIEWLKSNGIKNVIIGVAYHKEAIMNYFRDGSDFGIEIDYSVHSVEGETGEGFRLAINRYIEDETFIAMNGDEITNLDIRRLTDFHFQNNPLATIVVAPLQCPYGVVRIDNASKVVSFVEKPVIKSILVNTGIYVFDRRISTYLSVKGLIERTTFPRLVKLGLLKAYPLEKIWITIDSIRDLRRAETTLLETMRKGQWIK